MRSFLTASFSDHVSSLNGHAVSREHVLVPKGKHLCEKINSRARLKASYSHPRDKWDRDLEAPKPTGTEHSQRIWPEGTAPTSRSQEVRPDQMMYIARVNYCIILLHVAVSCHARSYKLGSPLSACHQNVSHNHVPMHLRLMLPGGSGKTRGEVLQSPLTLHAQQSHNRSAAQD